MTKPPTKARWRAKPRTDLDRAFARYVALTTMPDAFKSAGHEEALAQAVARLRKLGYDPERAR